MSDPKLDGVGKNHTQMLLQVSNTTQPDPFKKNLDTI